MSIPAQSSLRGLIEEYHATARFIFTCNYPNKIIPAIHSRCQGFHIEKLDITEFTTRVAEILIEEKVDFEINDLDTVVKATYPDLRKCTNTLQMNSLTSKLTMPSDSDGNSSDYKLEMINLFKQGKISAARKLICSQIRPEEVEDLFRFMYDNLQYFGKTEQQQDQAILIIKQGLVDHTICSDAEINMAATLVRLANIK